MIIKIFALILILVGVTFAYDARILANNWFGFGDQNEATSRIKNSRFYFYNDWSSYRIYFVRIPKKNWHQLKKSRKEPAPIEKSKKEPAPNEKNKKTIDKKE